MSYIVLARKYRPSKFTDLVGQEITAEILSNSIIQKRVAHSFLFCGSRGVGKTSCARILAKVLNCKNVQNAVACDNCLSCQEIIKGNAIDVYEIDGASHRGIENIREIQENSIYTPTRCKYKIYIIDETHMLTTEAFNALLKILEEPPDHIKFILATTEVHKIPLTIQSRCQKFDFLHISRTTIQNTLQKIADKESIKITPNTLNLLAYTAQGSMRDALTHFDMLINFCGENIDEKNAPLILGMPDFSVVIELIKNIIEKKQSEVLQIYQTISQKGYSITSLLQGLFETIHKIILCKITHTSLQENFLDISLQDVQIIEQVPISRLQQYFQILLETEQHVKNSQYGSICMEIGLIKLTLSDAIISIDEVLETLQKMKSELATQIPASPSQTKPTLQKKESENTASSYKTETIHQIPEQQTGSTALPPSQHNLLAKESLVEQKNPAENSVYSLQYTKESFYEALDNPNIKNMLLWESSHYLKKMEVKEINKASIVLNYEAASRLSNEVLEEIKQVLETVYSRVVVQLIEGEVSECYHTRVEKQKKQNYLSKEKDPSFQKIKNIFPASELVLPDKK